MRGTSLLLTGTGLGLALVAQAAYPQSSTETYDYDALGRLITVETSGGQNDSEMHSLCYDDAGNRTDYEGVTGSSTLTCTSGAAPPPSPPPSMITLTDSSLNVLSAHQATYDCSVTDIPMFNIHIKSCELDSDGSVVFYEDNGQQQFDPGYSMTQPYALLVTSSAYGTGQ